MRGPVSPSHTGTKSLRVCLLIPPILAMFGGRDQATLRAEERRRAAVLPFHVYASKPLESLVTGVQEMLILRLRERGYHMISPRVVAEGLRAHPERSLLKGIFELGCELKADWVIMGSVTQIGKRFSLDLKILDMGKRGAPFPVAAVAEDLEALAEAADRVVETIDNRIRGVAQIASVRVTGNHRIEKEAVLAMGSGQRRGGVLDYGELDKDLRDIYGMGFFTDVKIEIESGPTGKTVISRVTEKPSLAKIVFEGNRKVSEEKLRNQIGIKPYAILDPKEVTQGVNRLVAFYKQEGYYHIEVRDRIVELPGNQVLLKYEIAEGEKVPILRIEFAGNERFDDGTLKGLMKTSERGLFSWITKSGYLDQEPLDLDTQKIAAFYRRNGFVKVAVGEPQITYEGKKGLRIRIEIREGRPYAFGSVSVEGDLIRRVEELCNTLSLRKKGVFNGEKVRECHQRLRDVYADEGYAYAEVETLTKEDEKNLLVHVTYKITRGPRVRIGRINITGNTFTRDKVIRRALELKEGDYFSASALKRSIANLRRLGFFEDVDVHMERRDGRDLQP